jgi:hypothetical protein
LLRRTISGLTGSQTGPISVVVNQPRERTTTKETTMSKNENTGPQAAEPPRNPASASLGVAQSLIDQMAGWEREGYERMKTAAHDAVRLYGDALDHAAAMAAQWRAVYLKAAR